MTAQNRHQGAIAREAVAWAAALHDQRTAAIERGEDVPVDWIDERHRVSWSEILAEFPELAGVDGRLAYDRARRAPR